MLCVLALSALIAPSHAQEVKTEVLALQLDPSGALVELDAEALERLHGLDLSRLGDEVQSLPEHHTIGSSTTDGIVEQILQSEALSELLSAVGVDDLDVEVEVVVEQVDADEEEVSVEVTAEATVEGAQ